MPDARRLLMWHRKVLWECRFDTTGDLVGVAWVSVLARGTATGVKQAMAAYAAASR